MCLLWKLLLRAYLIFNIYVIIFSGYLTDIADYMVAFLVAGGISCLAGVAIIAVDRAVKHQNKSSIKHASSADNVNDASEINKMKE